MILGYSNGKVIIFDIESQLEIHSFDVNDDIAYLGWTHNSLELCEDRENDEENVLVTVLHLMTNTKISFVLIFLTELP